MPEVLQAALALRERAESYARATLHSEDAGHILLALAATILSREIIKHQEILPYFQLHDSLFQAYQELVLEELPPWEEARLRLKDEKSREAWKKEYLKVILAELNRPRLIPGLALGHIIGLTAFNIILKLKLLLVCFARWAGWLYFVDEHLLDDYIRHHNQILQAAGKTREISILEELR